MGYSYRVEAGFARDAIMEILLGPDNESSNTFERRGETYFYEESRTDYDDGRITGSVYRMIGDRCRRVGGVRIEGDGRITRFPTTRKVEREEAEIEARARYFNAYGWR